MVMKDSVSLYRQLADLVSYVNTYITNTIPSVHRDTRIHLLDEIYNLRKNILYSINTIDDNRINYLIDTKMNILMIELMFNDIKKMNCCKIDRLDDGEKMLNSIKKIVYDWIEQKICKV